MQGRARVLPSASAWVVAMAAGAMSWAAWNAAMPAMAADSPTGAAILMTRQWSPDGKVPTGTIWRTFQTWQTDVARTEKGELVRVDPLTQRAGVTDKGAKVRLTTNIPGWAYNTKIAKVELWTTEAVHGSPLPPADWQQGDFDDSTWASDPNPQLQLYGLVARLCLRGKFAVTDPAAAGELNLMVRYRGGAVVYLDGKEIGRGHLPAGPLKDDALAEDYPHEAYVDSEGDLIEQGIYRRSGDDRSPEVLRAAHIEGGLLQWNGSWKWRSVSCDNAGNGYFCNKDPQVIERYRSRCRKLEVRIPPAALRKGVNVLAIEIRRAAAWEGMFTSPCYCDGKKSRLAVNSAESWWDRCELEDVKLLSTGATGAAGAVVPNVAPPAGVRVWNHPAAVELDPSYYGNPNEALMPIRLRGLKNGTYSGQVVVGSTGAIRGLAAAATELKSSAGGVIPASAVQVSYPRIVDGFADNQAKAPGQFAVYDPLETAPPKEVAASPWNMGRTFRPVQPVWVTVRVPRDAPAGAYKGTLTVNVEGEKPTAVPVEMEVIGDWPLPDSTAFTTEVSLFECPDAVAKLYKVEMWSPEHWALLEKVFEVMGQLGVKDIYIPLVAKTHLGNPASMVRWVKQADGSRQCDTSIAERYIDLAVKHLGKLPRVCLYVSTRNQYDPPASRSKNEKDQPICSELDPAGGGKELKDFLPPKWGSAESQAFWKPAIERLRDVLAKRGLADSMMFGFCADGLGPAGGNADGMPNHFADLYAISPQTRWMVSTHIVAKSWLAGKKLRGPDFLGSHSWMFGFLFDVNWMDDHDTDTWKPTYGWRDRKAPPVELAASRSRSPTLYGDHCPNVTRCRVCPEAVLLSKKGGGDFGYQGFGTWGADFWGNEWNVFDAYGNVALSETTVCWLVGPGLTGPVPTCRTRMLQEGLQEAEMRIFVQNAVLDDDKRAKLGADLAKRCQDACEARTRAFTYMSYYRYSDGETDMPRLRVIPDLAAWDGEFVKLARLADEVAKTMKR